MVACFDSSNRGCTVATHKFSFKLQLYNNECKSGFDDGCVRVQSQPGCGTAVSISAVKIKIERVKVKKRLENSCNTNILMCYLEVGGGERVKEASGFSVIKHQDGKGCFCFPFCSFQWLYSNVILCTKPYYAWHGEKCAIWLLFLRLFIPVYFEFSQP